MTASGGSGCAAVFVVEHDERGGDDLADAPRAAAPAEASLAAAHETASEIAANPPLVVSGVKDVLDQQRIARVLESLRYVAAWNAAFLPSKDLTEGLKATFEKRKPEFTGE